MFGTWQKTLSETLLLELIKLISKHLTYKLYKLVI